MPNNETVATLLLEWEERAANGNPATLEELCRSRPELLPELNRRARLLGLIESWIDLEDEDSFSLPGFEVIEELGGGGMGVVYRARDTLLDRIVAIKTPRLGVLVRPAAKARFDRESKLLAQLRHPNIVSIHSVGLSNDRPFFVMDYVKSGALDHAKHAARLRANPHQAVRVVEGIARAVDHAHQQGILHRDLKPSNILLDEGDRPLVCDFGLATLFDSDVDDSGASLESVDLHSREWSRLTKTGAAVGTPAYMAPEQFDKSFGPIGPATDVWALGVVLYEFLTGESPFAGNSPEDTRQKVCELPVRRPRAVQRDLWRRLERIALRCLEKKPIDRFASAGALADELNRCLRKPRRVWWGTMAALVAVFLGLGAWIGSLPPAGKKPEPTDEEVYEERVAPLLSRVEQIKEVALIGPEANVGKMPPYRVRCGDGAVKSHMTDQGMVVRSPSLGIVEFLPRIPAKNYRISAEIRHDNNWFTGRAEGAVGLVFSARHVPSPIGTHHVFGLFRFSEWLEPVPMPGSNIPSNMGWLEAAWYLDPSENIPQLLPEIHATPADVEVYFPSVAPGEAKPFRAITIDVTPGGVYGWLDEWKNPKACPLLDSRFVDIENSLKQKQLEVPIGLQPSIKPTAGVFVYGGQCTIRNLRVVLRP